METFSVEIQIGDFDRERWVEMDALVDTGVFMMAVPGSVLRGLGVAPAETRRVRFADGNEARDMEIGYAWVRLEGKEAILQVLFNDEGTQPVIGWFGLDGLFLELDPDTKKFMPKVGLMPSIQTVEEGKHLDIINPSFRRTIEECVHLGRKPPERGWQSHSDAEDC